VIELMTLLADEPGLAFLFIGAGSGYRPLRAAVAARRLENVVFRPYQERAQLPLSLTAPDAHLVTLRPEWEGLVMPSKLYGVLAAGRPVLFIGDPAGDVARIEVLSEGLKRGRSMGFSRSRIVDADDHSRVIAYTEGQGVSIGTPPPGLERMDLDEPVIEIEDSPDLLPLWKVFGASRRADGHWVLPELAVELASPDAALHIGPQHILLETAAVDLASELAATDRLQMRGWHVMFLARGKVGPFRVDAAADRGPDGYVARVAVEAR
jgi:hypothetical protein